MYNKICKNCGCEFNTNNKNKVFCNYECYRLYQIQYNKISIYEDYALLHLNYKGQEYYSYIDIDDIDLVNKYKWHIHCRKSDGRLDVCSNGRGKHSERSYIILSRYLTKCPKDKVVDHINRNTLDNRKNNLKICTIFENNQNKCTKSGKIGVIWAKDKQKWKSSIIINKKAIFLGYYSDLDDAINARLNAENNIL